MRILHLVLFLAIFRLSALAQDTVFTASTVEAVEQSLASDAMRGRAVFTPDIERAADYIESQFRASGLRTLDNADSYRQKFTMIRPKLLAVHGTFNGTALNTENTIVISSAQQLQVDDHSGWQLAYIKAGDNLTTKVLQYAHAKVNYFVIIDTSFAKSFVRLNRIAGQQFKSDYSSVYVLSPVAATQPAPSQFSLTAFQDNKEAYLANVVGILPGKGKHKNEYVIFSGHYDHLGVRKPDARGDSIYNGANDDASGTTAVILLSRYFSKLHSNKRTLIFVAFTAEEVGEFGSQYFSSQFDPEKVVAMFNIEMIGSKSKWGTNSAFITGYERSDMGKILEKNLNGSAFRFYPDPYPGQHLFYRSDNASLARKGVPAHTISTTEIDIDKTYHTPEDEVSTLDLKNMAEIIRAIALSSKTIVQGKDTPSRVDTSQLQ
jgi:hypothetical protein